MKKPSSQRRYAPKRKPFEGNKSDGKQVHRSNRWTKKSISYRKQNPLCEVHEHYGRAVGSTLVDHIVRLQDNGASYDNDNLMALCSDCHNYKTGKEQHKQLIEYELNDNYERIPTNRTDIYTIFRDKIKYI